MRNRQQDRAMQQVPFLSATAAAEFAVMHHPPNESDS
jgi:hypothetical protein